MSRRELLIEAIDSITGDADRRKAERNLEAEYAELIAGGASVFFKDGVAVEPIGLDAAPVVVVAEPVLPAGSPVAPEPEAEAVKSIIAKASKPSKPKLTLEEVQALGTIYEDLCSYSLVGDVVNITGRHGLAACNIHCEIEHLDNAFFAATNVRRA